MLRLANRQDLESCSKALEVCQNMPAWLFYGKKDQVVLPICSEHIIESLAMKGDGSQPSVDVRVTAYKGVGHACWVKAYNTLELYTWLLEHSL